MDIKLVDVTIHIDETIEQSRRPELVDTVRQQDGVVSVGYHDEKPHLMIIEYNPEKISSKTLLQTVKDQGLHAELIGL
jgi:hypothetical protein